MPALSFQERWLDALLSGSKQQTTRPQTDRIKIGHVVSIYNQQRRRIIGKPLRQLTALGSKVYQQRIYDNSYPTPPEMVPNDLGFWHVYFAHLLGKVEIVEVYDIHPCEMAEVLLEAWAVADGFKGFHPLTVPPDRLYDGANMWFQRRYGDDWMQRWWTVIRWDGWTERYFEPEEGD